MKERSLMYKSLAQFIICVVILLLLATPLFYGLTKSFYAEDMIDIIEAVQVGKPIPSLNLEEDILHGIMIQFALITIVLGTAIVLMLRFISGRLWQPFDKTLEAIEHFKLENGTYPALPKSNVKEFNRLNKTLERLMTDSIHSYRLQKEFTENASHELQTPLAVFQSKLDLLLQQPEITERQATIIQDLYQMNIRLSRLNRNLLLLAKMENNQFDRTESIDVVTVIKELLPYLECLSEGLVLNKDFPASSLSVKANRTLLESMINNLIVNAVRHNRPEGEISIVLSGKQLVVMNTSGHGHRIDAALHFRSPMATVRQDTGSDRALQTGKRDVPCPAEKQRKRIQQAQQDLGKADDRQYPQLPVAKGIHRKRLA